MKFFFLAVFTAFSINISFAQLAEERTAPFSAAKYEGGKLKVLVEKNWYQLNAIDGVSTTSIINQCREEDDEDWMEVFSEDIVEVMQALGKPLKTQAKLSLYKNGTPITKTVSVTKEKRRAAREYHNTHGISSTFAKDEHEATRKENWLNS